MAGKLYSLLQAEWEFGFAPGEILSLGAAGHIALCVRPPQGGYAFCVAANLDVLELDDVSDRPVRPRVQLGAVVLDQATCGSVSPEVQAVQAVFSSAYGIDYWENPDREILPERIWPERFVANVRSPVVDRVNRRFCFFDSDKEYQFLSSYSGPLPVRFKERDVLVSGIDIIEFFDLKNPIPVISVSRQKATKKSAINSVEQVDNNVRGVLSVPATVVPEPTKESNIPSIVSPTLKIVRLDMKGAAKKLGVGTSTIDAMLRKGSPQYDPTFPEKRYQGRRVYFIESELDAWEVERERKRKS